jgi:hypothetical protein
MKRGILASGEPDEFHTGSVTEIMALLRGIQHYVWTV